MREMLANLSVSIDHEHALAAKRNVTTDHLSDICDMYFRRNVSLALRSRQCNRNRLILNRNISNYNLCNTMCVSLGKNLQLKYN